MTSWAVELQGHQFDLLDWRDNFRAAFDPSVVASTRTDVEGPIFLLKSKSFNEFDKPEEVRRAALPSFAL